MAIKMDAQDKQWQRGSDARTLAEASTIRKDKSRFKGAVSEAKVMAKEENTRLSSLRTVANIKLPKAKRK